MDLWKYAPFVWSVIIGIPGIVAFGWQVRDRRRKRLAEDPYSEWKIFGRPDEEGWYTVKFFVANRWDEAIFIKRVALKGAPGAIIRIPQGLPQSDTDSDVVPAATGIRFSDWRVSPKSPSSSGRGNFSFSVKPASRKSGESQSTLIWGEKVSLVLDIISASNRRTSIICTSTHDSKPAQIDSTTVK